MIFGGVNGSSVYSSATHQKLYSLILPTLYFVCIGGDFIVLRCAHPNQVEYSNRCLCSLSWQSTSTYSMNINNMFTGELDVSGTRNCICIIRHSEKSKFFGPILPYTFIICPVKIIGTIFGPILSLKMFQWHSLLNRGNHPFTKD